METFPLHFFCSVFSISSHSPFYSEHLDRQNQPTLTMVIHLVWRCRYLPSTQNKNSRFLNRYIVYLLLLEAKLSLLYCFSINSRDTYTRLKKRSQERVSVCNHTCYTFMSLWRLVMSVITFSWYELACEKQTLPTTVQSSIVLTQNSSSDSQATENRHFFPESGLHCSAERAMGTSGITHFPV